jgi:hypothetical protein
MDPWRQETPFDRPRSKIWQDRGRLHGLSRLRGARRGQGYGAPKRSQITVQPPDRYRQRSHGKHKSSFARLESGRAGISSRNTRVDLRSARMAAATRHPVDRGDPGRSSLDETLTAGLRRVDKALRSIRSRLLGSHATSPRERSGAGTVRFGFEVPARRICISRTSASGKHGFARNKLHPASSARFRSGVSAEAESTNTAKNCSGVNGIALVCRGPAKMALATGFIVESKIPHSLRNPLGHNRDRLDASRSSASECGGSWHRAAR